MQSFSLYSFLPIAFYEFGSDGFRYEESPLPPTTTDLRRQQSASAATRELLREDVYKRQVPGGDLDVDLLPKEMRKTPNQDAHVAASDLGIEAPIVPLVELEEAAIRRALLRYGRSGEGKLKAAQALGLSKATLYRKIKEYGV